MNSAGFCIYAPDRRGAGLNKHERGHLGSARQYLNDVEMMLTYISQRHPGRPLFLLANCWAAAAGVLLAARQADRFAGLILTCPALKTHVDMTLSAKLQIVWCWLTGSRRVFEIPISLPMFTANPLYLDYLNKDPLRITRATATFFVETIKLRAMAHLAAKSLTTPVLVLQSGQDKITDNTGTQKWFDRLCAQDKTIKTFSEAEHTLDFEQNNDGYLSTLIQWIHARGQRRLP